MVVQGMIKFNTVEMHDLFNLMNYPYIIRNDAITAVGAPSTISFLIKAIYWLYITVFAH